MFRVRTLLLSAALLAACCAASAQSTDVFLTKYSAFEAERLRGGRPDVLEVKLGHVKGLSRSFVAAAGDVSIDLASGKYVATLRGLEKDATYSLWLVDRYESEDGIDRLFNDARMVKLADVPGSRVLVSGTLGTRVPADFSLDRIHLLRGTNERGEVAASGSLNVFQKLFYRGLAVTKAGGAAALSRPAEARPAFAWLIPELAAATLEGEEGQTEDMPINPEAAALQSLIDQGGDLFFNGTFNGNGRTCGTCHPKSNNFTIDVPFIASLPANDPLFVAENVPALAGLEKPALMRQFGLILENLDGLDDPTNKFVMRSVPHTLGLQVSLAQNTTLPGAPIEMTGWSGDGAPGAGSLRDFAVGAVTQHFTKSLARVENTDFKLPTESQLDAMEAFQLSLGRSEDFNLTTLVFTNATVDAGKVIFRDGTGDPLAQGRCSGCHGNGGALAANFENLNINTNVEDAVNPARAVQTFPIDGGFGQTPLNADGSRGNRTFNTAPVVEAADTAPFFHSNIAATLEDVLTFYTGPEFNNPRAVTGRFAFNATQRTQLTAFMRSLNALQNIQIARRPLQEIMDYTGNSKQVLDPRLDTAAFETDDAIAVLNQQSLYPGAVANLTVAAQKIAQAKVTNNKPANRALVQDAINQLDAARIAIAP